MCKAIKAAYLALPAAAALVLTTACAHKMGVYRRDWSEGHPSGEVMFVDNAKVAANRLQGAEAYAPALWYREEGHWKEVRQRTFESGIYAPFVSAPWFFLVVPAGQREFRLVHGSADTQVTVDVQDGMIHVVPFAIRHLTASESATARKLEFAFEASSTETIPGSSMAGAEAQLREALRSEQPGTRYRACRELERLRKEGRLTAETLDKLRQLAGNDAVELVREGASKALGGG